MTASSDGDKPFDLEERTLLFAKQIRAFFKKLPRSVANAEDGRQLIRSSGSIGANYIEANEALGKNDFLMRVRIARREAKESVFFLRLLDTGADPSLQAERLALVKEADELLRILCAIIRKRE